MDKAALLAADGDIIALTGGKHDDEEEEGTARLYASRWWVLAVYSMLAFMQGWMWAIPGPISAVIGDLYGVDSDTIQLFINYGPIFYLPLSFPLAYWMDRPGGVRQSVLWAIATVSVGHLCRTLATDASATSVALLHVSYFLNAIAGPVAMGAVGKISEDWFPTHFRATSTAIMSEANLFGGAAAQLIGPSLVTDNDWGQLARYNYVCAALCGVMLIGAFAYFPSHPPTPPSRSATTTKANESSMTLGALWQALRALLVSRDFWVLSMAYGLTTGMYGSWATVLSLNLPGCDPQWIGWLSFSSTIAGNVGGLVLGRFADRFRHMKRLLVGLMAVSGLCFTGFAVFASPGLVNSVVCHADGSPGSGMWPLFVLGVLGGLFLNSAIPLFYELSLEVTYPIPEATVCIQLTNWNNIGCLIFLGIPVSQYGSAWMNWLFGGTIVVFTGLLVAFFREKTKRYDVDTGKGGAGKALIGDGEEVVGLIQ